MKYSSFQIKNFKGIQSLTFDLKRSPKSQIHTLVGLNESGKTTILEAIDYFEPSTEELDPIELSGRIKPEAHELIPISKRANFNGEMRITTTLEFEPNDFDALARFIKDSYGFRIKTISEVSVSEAVTFENSLRVNRNVYWTIDIVGRTANGRSDRQLIVSHVKGDWMPIYKKIRSLMPPIWYFPNFLFEFPTRIYLEEQPGEDKKDKFYRAVLKDILNAFDQNATLEEHILKRAKSGPGPDKNALDQLLLELGRMVSEDVFQAWDDMFKRKITKSVDLRIQEEEGTYFIEFRIVDADGFFAIHERSLGFRWFFIFLLLTTYRGFRKDSPANIMFLLDEPASNLHATAQTQLLNCLEQLANKSTLIYTTHSHHLINPLWLENTYVVRNLGIEIDQDVSESHGAKTNIVLERYRTFAGQHPDQATYFQPILDMLDYAPSKLELVPDMVMVEGKNDFYSLSYMNDIVLKLGLDLHLLPGGGAGSLESMIKFFIGWGRNFIVVLDSDGAGTKEAKRYKEMFGITVENRIFRLSDFHSSFKGKSLDGALDKGDRDSILEFAYPGQRYTKATLYRSLQEAYAAKSSVSLSANGKKQFTELLTNIHKAVQAAK